VGVDDSNTERLQRVRQELTAVIAPLRSAIPETLWKYFPESLLNSAAVDSYKGQRMLEPFFDDIYVHPHLYEKFDIYYICKNSLEVQLKSALSPDLFDILLMYNYIG